MPTVRVVWNPFSAAERKRHAPEPLPAASLPFHKSLPGYQPTPLIELPALARELGIGRLLVKDESKRFGLNAFKSLGASYAISAWLSERCMTQLGKPFSFTACSAPDVRRLLEAVTLTTATDGNHGRAVAWMAKLIGVKAVVFMPKGSVEARVRAIRELGAEVIIVDGDYDAAVRTAAYEAEKHGRQVISDTSWPGYVQIPGWIQAGYYTLMYEVSAELKRRGMAEPDVVFVQAGVGALAAAAGAYYRPRGKKRPLLVCVEPAAAACMAESAEAADGKAHTAKGGGRTIMAGLNCGTPSMIAWPAIMSCFDAFVVIDDVWAERAMRRMARPLGGDPAIVSGESGAAGLAALLAVLSDEAPDEARSKLGLRNDAAALVINTEGDTDPDNYAKVTGTNTSP